MMIDNHFLQKASITPGFVSACRTLVVRNWSGTIGRDAGTGWRDWSPHSFQTRHRSVQHRLPDGRHLPVNNLSFDRRGSFRDRNEQVNFKEERLQCSKFEGEKTFCQEKKNALSWNSGS